MIYESGVPMVICEMMRGRNYTVFAMKEGTCPGNSECARTYHHGYATFTSAYDPATRYKMQIIKRPLAYFLVRCI